MKMIEKEMTRAPFESEQEMIVQLNGVVIGSSLSYLIGAILAFLGSIVLPIIAIKKNIFELSAIVIVIWAIVVFVFGSSVIVTIVDYTKARKGASENLDKWLLIDGIADEVITRSYSCEVHGTIGTEKKRQVVLKLESNAIEDLFKDKSFVLFDNGDALIQAVGISGQVMLADAIDIGEVCCDEND